MDYYKITCFLESCHHLILARHMFSGLRHSLEINNRASYDINFLCVKFKCFTFLTVNVKAFVKKDCKVSKNRFSCFTAVNQIFQIPFLIEILSYKKSRTQLLWIMITSITTFYVLIK